MPDREGLDARRVIASSLVANNPVDIAERLLRADMQSSSEQ